MLDLDIYLTKMQEKTKILQVHTDKRAFQYSLRQLTSKRASSWNLMVLHIYSGERESIRGMQMCSLWSFQKCTYGTLWHISPWRFVPPFLRSLGYKKKIMERERERGLLMPLKYTKRFITNVHREMCGIWVRGDANDIQVKTYDMMYPKHTHWQIYPVCVHCM